MTGRFWIESITITGEDVKPSRITFKPGFNIIHGPSDTGKTYLAKTIKYMLAGSTKPFSTDTGYTKIKMRLRSEEGKIDLTRQIGSSKVLVEPDLVFGIFRDEYDAAPTESNTGEMTVSDILLRLLGVTEARIVLTNQYGGRKKLTWKSFSDTLHRSESRITLEETIFSTLKYTTLSAFLTLFYDQDLSLLPEHADPAELNTRKNILGPHIDQQIKQREERIQELGNQIEALGERDIEAELKELSRQLNGLNAYQDTTRRTLTQLTTAITKAEEDLSIKQLTAAKYDDLSDVYLGNLKRLTFVTEAQNAIDDSPQITSCPFCDNPIDTHDHIDYKVAAQAESDTIIGDLKELRQVQATLATQIVALQSHLKELRSKQQEAEQKLTQAVLPTITKVQENITTLRQYQELKSEYETLTAQWQSLGEQLYEVQNPPTPPSEYNPVERFPNEFYNEMTRYLQEILKEVHYAQADKATFNREDFDIRIGYKTKRSHGKGYRAFFNTIMVLALRRYIHEHAEHKPSIVVLDTPTLGLEHQKSRDGLVTSRDENGRPKQGLLRNLFDHMVDTGKFGQLIILNNTDVTPTTYFNSDDSTELVFGEHEEADRSGLLIDLREGDEVADIEGIEQPSLLGGLDSDD